MSAEEAPANIENSKFQPAVPDLSSMSFPDKEGMPTNNVIDISRAREAKEIRRGRPPKDEQPRKIDIAARKRDVGDLVGVDDAGRGRDPKGRFISEANMRTIEANADYIRQNAPDASPQDSDTRPDQVPTETPAEISQQPAPEVPDAQAPQESTEPTQEPPAEVPPDIYEEYTEAVRNGSAKDKTFREWVRSTEDPKAARWWEATRAHGEAEIARSGNGADSEERGSGDIDPRLLMDQDHRERLNGREGKPNPTQDDIDYYLWQSRHRQDQPGEQTQEPGQAEPNAPEPTPTPEDPGDQEPIQPPEPTPTPEDPRDQEPTLPTQEPTPIPEQPIGQEPPGGPEGPDEPEGPEIIEGPPLSERLADAAARMDLAIERFARARVNSERMFGGKNDAEMVEASTELQRAYHELCGVLAERAATRTAEAQGRLDGLTQQREALGGMAAAAQERLTTLEPNDPEVQTLLANIAALEQRQAEIAEREAAEQAEIAAIEAQNQQEIAQVLVRARGNVDAEMIKEEERTSPALGKIANWLRKHSGVRIVAGIGLAGIGIFGAVTGNVPLVVGAMAARAGLSAIGGYNASRGVGELVAGRRYQDSDVSTVEGYTDAAQRQSRTRRRSKKTGAVVGAGLAAIPIVRGIGQLSDMAHAAPKPAAPDVAPKAPVAAPDVPTPGHPDLALVDDRLPWTHMTERIGSNGTPRILEIAQKAPSVGWRVDGNGLGGGLGGIIRVVAPDGYVYQGNAAINAAFDHLDKLIAA